MAAGKGWLDKFARWIVREEAAGEYKMYCPLHENPDTSKTPSASMNPERGKFMCFSRCGGLGLGTVWQYVRDGYTPPAKVQHDEPRDIGSAPSRRKAATEGEELPLPAEDKVAEWHERLVANRRLVNAIGEKRGLNTRTLQRFGIGWNGERIMIPIRDADGGLVNVRQYKMGAAVAKVINWPGHGDANLYGLDALEAKAVILTAGEMDKLIGRQHRLPTLTATAGEGTWFAAWSPLFTGKRVYIVYDCDDQGRKGARKVAAALNGVAEWVRIVDLGLAGKGADLTDWFVSEAMGRKAFVDLMQATPVAEAKTVSRQRAQAEPEHVRISQSFDPAYAGKPMSMVATISGRAATPSLLPKKMDLDCDMGWQKPKCENCPMSHAAGHRAHSIAADDEVLLKMMGKPDDLRRAELLAGIGVPRTCPRVEVTPLDHWRVDELAVVPNVDDPEETNGESLLRRVLNVTEEAALTPVNTTARITGVSVPDPKNAQVVFQSWLLEETKTSLDKFTMTPELKALLENTFQPHGHQEPLDKLREIANDLAANITHIWGRPELHMAYDLVWHSVLDFKFRGTHLGKGWLELMVMGDTRTGKSEAATRLMGHYGAGVLKSCEGATLAGLVGGAQQIGNSWVITWGTIPLQDRRLVVLDEVSGIADKNILEQMSAVRSSGKAQVNKIVSQETNARTRLIWISNPPDGRFINQTTNGAIDAIAKLVTNPEDIARFDLAMVAASDDVSSSVINAARPPRADHSHTAEACSALVTWAWSRKRDDVVWDTGVERYILQQAEALGSRYIADPPLIQPENVRVKLARLAVAVAARLFSHDGTGEKVFVTKAHVRASVKFIDDLYGMRWFGYGDHSRKELRAKQAAHNSAAECRRWLLERDRVLNTLRTVINDTQFRSRDLEEFGGIDKEEAATHVGELLRMGMIRRRSKGYINMMPELIRIVRELEED